MNLKEIREQKKLTQAEAARFCGVSRRSYQNYEMADGPKDSIRYRYIAETLQKYGYIDEEHGILALDEIKKAVKEVSSRHKVSFVYLFGSYAKNKARADSDVDLLVSSQETGLHFYGLVEEYREALHKKVDVLGMEQLGKNPDLSKEILKDGIKIYG
jgi:predicted nucleotidyltransferase/DNA-binding XRE family transcriptional regulator